MMEEGRKHRFRPQYGATAIEYGLIAALIAVVIISALTALGTALSNTFESAAEPIENADPGASEDDPTESATPPETEQASTATGVPSPQDTATATKTLTPTPESKPSVIRDVLCWRGPGSAYEVVSALKEGDVLEVLGAGMEPGWLIVDNPSYPGVLCWAPAESIEIPAPLILPDTLFAVPPVPTSTPEKSKKMGCSVNGKCEVPCPVPGQYPVCYK